MILFSKELLGKPIGSIHAGHRVATTESIIIDPNNLTIAGLTIQNPKEPENSLLLTADIRQFSKQGILINHEEDLSSPEDIVRMQKVIAIHYAIAGKRVETQSGKKIGIARDFTFDHKTLSIQHIYTQPRGVKLLKSPDRIIGRKQIVKTTDKKIIIKDSTESITQTRSILSQVRDSARLQTNPARSKTAKS